MPSLDVQADIRKRLSDALSPVDVRITVPEDRPKKLVVVEHEGRRSLNAVQDRTGIGILAWAPSEIEARSLIMRAGELIRGLPRTSFLGGYESCVEEKMLPETDPETGSPRWYASYTITTHEPVKTD